MQQPGLASISFTVRTATGPYISPIKSQQPDVVLYYGIKRSQKVVQIVLTIKTRGIVS